MRSAARVVPSSARIARPSAIILDRSSPSVRRRSTAPRSSASSNSYVGRRTPKPTSSDPLSVVLVPEQRQHHHGLAEAEGLGRRVVASVGDDEVAAGDHVRLREPSLAPYLVGQVELVRAGTLRYDVAVR